MRSVQFGLCSIRIFFFLSFLFFSLFLLVFSLTDTKIRKIGRDME